MSLKGTGEVHTVRLDKFLKVSRLIKRRTLAKEFCDRGLVTLNGRAAKASTEVKRGDYVTVNFGSRRVTVEILDCQENVPAKMAAGLYRVLEEKKITEENEFSRPR
ncbi:MAG: RNA-binding S4 domain-containing protein [Desulfotomaculales bacterium]